MVEERIGDIPVVVFSSLYLWSNTAMQIECTDVCSLFQITLK